MFVGHTAVALAAKCKERRVSLMWFVAAAFGLDLLWPVFLLIGAERVRIVPGATAFTPLLFESYPWSHSLLMACAWGLCAAGLARWRGLPTGAAVLSGLLVVSHWVLDLIMHAPDLPLWPGPSPLLGLGLWNVVAGTLLVEGALFLAAIALYTRTTSPVDRVGSIGLWTFLFFLTVIWVSGPWSPPPPSERVLAWVALSVWLLVGWAGLVDRHRR